MFYIGFVLVCDKASCCPLLYLLRLGRVFGNSSMPVSVDFLVVQLVLLMARSAPWYA